MHVRGAVALLALVAGALAPAAAGEDEPATRLPLNEARVPAHEEDWYAIWLLEVRAGWTRYAIDRASPADATRTGLVRVTQENHYEVKYAGATQTRMETKILEFDARPPYALVGGEVSNTDEKGRRTMRLTRTPTGIKAVRADSAEVREAPMGALDFTLEDQLTPRSWLAAGRKVGDVLVCRSFDPLTLVVKTGRFTVFDAGSLGAPGGTARWVDVRAEDSSSGRTSLIRYDPGSGRAFYMVQGGYRALLTTESGAKMAEPGGDLLDVLAYAKVDAPLGRAREITALVLEARGPGTEKIPSGPGQSVAREPGTGEMVVTLGEGAGPAPEATAVEIAQALIPAERYGAGRPDIALLSAQGTAGAKTPRERVSSLAAFVMKYVQYDVQPGDKPIDEILRTRRGDCSEMAILFAALARAAGVPAREVEGLSYMGDAALAFAGHRWNEVVLDGRWVPVDATVGEVPADVPRIALARGAPPGESVSVLAFGAASFHLRERRPAK